MKQSFYKLRVVFVKFGQFLSWIFSKLLLKFILDVEIHKKDYVKNTGKPTLILSNHTSLVDPFMFMGSISWQEFKQVFPLRAMLAKWYFHSLAPIAYFIGCFPARSLIKPWKKYAGTSGAVRYLERGSSIGMFPEGVRNQKQGSIPAKYGVVKILSQINNPTIYIMKIKRKSWRKYTLIINQDDSVAKIKDPEQIMEKIYALK